MQWERVQSITVQWVTVIADPLLKNKHSPYFNERGKSLVDTGVNLQGPTVMVAGTGSIRLSGHGQKKRDRLCCSAKRLISDTLIQLSWYIPQQLLCHVVTQICRVSQFIFKFIDSEERGGMGYMELYTAQCLQVETVGNVLRPETEASYNFVCF